MIESFLALFRTASKLPEWQQRRLSQWQGLSAPALNAPLSELHARAAVKAGASLQEVLDAALAHEPAAIMLSKAAALLM